MEQLTQKTTTTLKVFSLINCLCKSLDPRWLNNLFRGNHLFGKQTAAPLFSVKLSIPHFKIKIPVTGQCKQLSTHVDTGQYGSWCPTISWYLFVYQHSHFHCSVKPTVFRYRRVSVNHASTNLTHSYNDNPSFTFPPTSISRPIHILLLAYMPYPCRWACSLLPLPGYVYLTINWHQRLHRRVRCWRVWRRCHDGSFRDAVKSSGVQWRRRHHRPLAWSRRLTSRRV